MSFVGLTWILFSVPMLLSFVGGYLADRHSRFVLMFAGYAVSATCWIVYGSTRSLTLFLVFAVVEATATHSAALVGTLASPLLYEVMSGRVIALSGVLALLGLGIAAPVLSAQWRRLANVPASVPEPAGDESL